MLEIVQRLKAVLFHHADDLFLHPVQIFIRERKQRGRRVLFVVQLCVVDVVDGAVHDVVHQRGNDGFAPFGQQEIFQMGISERRILDVDLPDDAHLDLFFRTAAHGRKTLEERFCPLFVRTVLVFVERLANDFQAILARGVGSARFQFVRFTLVVQGHEHVPVKDGKREFEDHFQRDGEPAVLFQSRKVEGNDGDFGELRLERLADERDIVGCAASAARLRDHDRRVFGVVFPAFERVDKLPRDAQRGIAGIVVNVFEPLVDDGARIVVQDLYIPAVLAQEIDDDAEMEGKHIGNEDLVRVLHFGRKFGVRIAEIRDGNIFIFFHRNASSVLLWRRAYCADGS